MFLFPQVGGDSSSTAGNGMTVSSTSPLYIGGPTFSIQSWGQKQASKAHTPLHSDLSDHDQNGQAVGRGDSKPASNHQYNEHANTRQLSAAAEGEGSFQRSHMHKQSTAQQHDRTSTEQQQPLRASTRRRTPPNPATAYPPPPPPSSPAQPPPGTAYVLPPSLIGYSQEQVKLLCLAEVRDCGCGCYCA